MMRPRIATIRTFLICLLALAVLGFRAPVADPSGSARLATVTSEHRGHSHDHHGHSHDDEDEPTATSAHDHDGFHVGDHSHDTPAAAVLIGFRFGSPRDQGPGTPDDRVASRPTPPGDRPPRHA
jgi:hypothetical protein